MTSSTTDTRPMIFISHATKDDAYADRVAESLQAAGFATWVDHQHGIEPGASNWDRAIRAALPECAAAVLVMTSRSLASDNCAAECITIRELSKPLYVAYLDTVKPDEIWLYIKMIQYADLRGDFDAGMQAIVRVLKGKADEIRPDDPTPIRGKVTGYGVMREHLPYLTTVPLTGRDADLAAIRSKLGQHVTQITAVGGTGKSRIAAEIALSHPTGAVWHRCSGTSQAGDVVELLRQHMGLPKEVQPDDVFAQLERTAAPLIVIDNTEDVPDTEPARREAYVKLMHTLTDYGPVLLTSRVAWHELKPRIAHALEPLEDIETAAKIATEFATAENVALDDAAALATAALKHPRLIEFAVRQLHERSLQQVLRQLRELKHEEVEEALTEMIHKTVAQMCEQARRGAAAESLLKRLTVFRGTFSPEAAFEIAYPKPKYRLNAFVAFLKTGKKRTDNIGEFDEALATLLRWRLVRRDRITNCYRVDDVVIKAMPADEAISQQQFEYYFNLHGNYDLNTDHKRHPQIEADWQNIRTALAWGLNQDNQDIIEVAVKFVIALDYTMAFRVSHAERQDWLERARTGAVKIGNRLWEAQTLHYLGEVARLQANYARAIDYYQQARQVYSEVDDTTGQANVLHSQGELARQQNDIPAALEYLKQALQGYREIGNRLGQANVLDNLGDVARLQEEYPTALERYQQAHETYREIGNRLGQANTLQNLGDVARMQYDIPAAREYYQQALQGYHNVGPHYKPANVLQKLGNMAYKQDDYPNALEYLKQALSIYHEIGNRLGQANVLQKMGEVTQRQNDIPSALEYLRQAQQLYREISNQIGQANVLQKMGEVAQLQADYLTAIDYYHQAQEVYREIGNQFGLGNILYKLGGVAAAQDDTDTALEYLKQALQAYEEIGNQFRQADVLQSLGYLLLTQADYPTALNYLKQAQQLYRKVGSRAGQANVLKSLGDAAHMQANYPTALDYYHKAQEAYHEIGNQLGQANVLKSLGDMVYIQSDYSSALEYLKQAEHVYHKIGSRLGQARALQSLGEVTDKQDDISAAIEYYQQAQQVYSESDSPYGQANVLQSSGDIARMQEEYDAARIYYRQAIELAESIPDLSTQLNAWRGLARAEQQAGNLEAACEAYRKCLALADASPFFRDHPVVAEWRQEYAELGCGDTEDSESS